MRGISSGLIDLLNFAAYSRMYSVVGLFSMIPVSQKRTEPTWSGDQAQMSGSCEGILPELLTGVRGKVPRAELPRTGTLTPDSNQSISVKPL